MAKLLYNVRAYADDTAGWTADKTVYPENAILINTETGSVKRGDGENAYANCESLGIDAATAWGDISGKPAVIAEGTTAANAWAKIQSGAIGTGATKAAAGNHNHAVTADETSGLAAAANIQALAVLLSARIKVVEAGTIAVEADETSGLAAAADIQSLAEALSARIKDLEDA